jgi:hypothetical protein
MVNSRLDDVEDPEEYPPLHPFPQRAQRKKKYANAPKTFRGEDLETTV